MLASSRFLRVSFRSYRWNNCNAGASEDHERSTLSPLTSIFSARNCAQVMKFVFQAVNARRWPRLDQFPFHLSFTFSSGNPARPISLNQLRQKLAWFRCAANSAANRTESFRANILRFAVSFARSTSFLLMLEIVLDRGRSSASGFSGSSCSQTHRPPPAKLFL